MAFLIFNIFFVSLVFGQKNSKDRVAGRAICVSNNDPGKVSVNFIGMSVPGTDIYVKKEQAEEDTLNIGYGTILKSRNPTAISVITREQMDLTINQNLQQAIQGRAAGVYVSPSSKYGDNSMQVRIRGIGTAFGSGEPLYVIDGMPIQGNIDMLNPAEIERIEILKDAASCAIYGSRGGNGVVLISTKR